MASTVDELQSRMTTWDAVKKRRLSHENAIEVTIDVPERLSKHLVKPGDSRPRLQASKIIPIDDDHSKGPGPYTQQHLAASTPGPTQNSLLDLSHPRYGLPKQLVWNLRKMGIHSIYPWQSSCLLGRGNLSGARNLVYTAPTGGGKSLVADVLMLKRVVEGRKAMLVLPYVALIQEKLKWLRRAVEGLARNTEALPRPRRSLLGDSSSICVAGFYGGSKTRDHWIDVDIAVCTIEKANSLINSAITESTTQDLGIVVIDEMHMLDDDHRGYILEVLAAKILSLNLDLQLVGMSATLQNVEVLAEWLKAKSYVSKYKPIPIQEHLVCDNTIYALSPGMIAPSQGEGAKEIVKARLIEPSEDAALKNPIANAVVALALETVAANYGVLVFCNSRMASETTAVLIARAMKPLQTLSAEVVAKRQDFIDSLKSLVSIPLDEAIADTVRYGVAFHHAGLTTEEREILAAAFDSGALRVIVATCSLAAGINLPARRVILQGTRMGREMVGPAMLRQMRGRAGRKGKDEIGETYVCCKTEELEEVQALLGEELSPIRSSLMRERRGIKRSVLECVAIRLGTHELAVREFIGRTLLAQTTSSSELEQMTATAIRELQEAQLITAEGQCYAATDLGQATVASGLSPEDGTFVSSELERAMSAFVMDGEMHVFYMFTPISAVEEAETIDWGVFRHEIAALDESGLRALTACGVNPGFVNQQANSRQPLKVTSTADIAKARIHRRFYVALQLRDLCNEVPLHAVARKYHVARGSLQSLLQSCQGFAASTIRFCKQMQWGMLAAVLEHMSDRLQAGARADLLELAQVPFIKSHTARVLWENGYRGVRGLAEADPADLAQVLMLAQPQRRRAPGSWEKEEDSEAGYLSKLHATAEIVIAAASRIWERQQMVDVEGEL